LLNAADARPNHVALLSAVSDEYSPEGKRLLSATFLGVPDETDEELATEVRDAMASWYPEHSFANLELVPNAQLVQPPGFQSRVPAQDAPEGPVVLAGDYTRWSSIQGALESGGRAAALVLD
jgi:monoamine oxidase